MPTHVNLIKRKLVPSRRNVVKEKSKKVWYIAKCQSGRTYYLSDFDKNQRAALWSVFVKNGLVFRTNQGVNQYIAAYLNNRTDIHLVHTEEAK